MKFQHIANKAAKAAGSFWAFTAAFAIVLVWAVTGPYFHFSEVWQLVINTGTTIITFLMVFLIQNSQNRGDAALHAKLDELIRSSGAARNELVGLETKAEEEITEAAKVIQTAAAPAPAAAAAAAAAPATPPTASR